LSKFIENIRSLGKKRLIAAGIAFFLTAAVISSLAYFATRPDMTLLYTGMDPSEAGQVVAALEEMGIPVQASGGGTAVSVPRAQIDRARMALATRGLPSTPGAGYEIFDQADGFGLTTFMQRMNRLRAMEGELARTVATIEGVDGARVHLVLPDRESFSRNAPDPSASVVVTMKPGRTLEIAQARAIRHLVASAVPGLKVEAVTISDSTGKLLITDGDTSGQGSDARSAIESKLQRNVEDLLTARLGPGNVRVGVTVEIETSREVIRSQQFDPDGRVVRSTQTVEDKQRSSEGSTDQPVTVEQNLPDAELLGGTGPSSAATTSDRIEETVNYEISNEVREKTIEPGDIRRIAVAVLVNGSYVDRDGTPTYVERSAEEIANLEELVRTAIGYNDDRGDQVTVRSLEFARVDNLGTTDELTISQMLAANAGTIAMWVLLAIMSVLLLLFVIRPLVTFLTEQAAPARDNDLPAPPEAPAGDPEVEINISSQQVMASKEALIVGLHEAVDENPDEAVAVLRAWIQEGSI